MMFLLVPNGKEGDEAQHDGKEGGRPPSFECSQPAQSEIQEVPPADNPILSSGSQRPRVRN